MSLEIEEANKRFLDFKVCYKCKIKNKKILLRCRKCNSPYFRDKRKKIRRK